MDGKREFATPIKLHRSESTDVNQPMPWSFSYKKGGYVKSYDPGYKEAKKKWKGTAVYNKGAIQKMYRYNKVSVRQGITKSRKNTAIPKGIYKYSATTPSPLPRIAGKEVKYKDLHVSKTVVVDATSDKEYEETGFGCLADTAYGITQNNTAHGRVGQRIFLKSLELSFQVCFALQDSDDADGYVAGDEPYRVCVILDKQPNKALPYAVASPNPSNSEIFEINDDSTNVVLMPMAFQKISTSKRFKILADKVYNIKGSDTLSVQSFTQTSRRIESLVVPLSGITSIYAENTTTGFIGTLETNNVFVLYGFENQATGVRFNSYLMEMNSRLSWTD